MKKSFGNGIRNVLIKGLVPVIILLVWEYSLRTEQVPNSLVASPSQVIQKFFEMLFDGRLFGHAYVSMKRLLFGFILGTSLGIAMGTIVGFWRLGAKLIEPTLLALLPVPPIAWIPFLIIFFGIDEASKIALISIGSFWTLFLQTSYGIRTVDKNLVEVALILKKDWKTILRRVMLPSCLPHIFSGMRVALAISWGLLVASEIIASSKGIGWLIWDARNFSRPADLIVGMITAGILGKATDSIIVWAEKKYTKWRITYRDIQ
jgi:sulfonate transport system permease protein